MAKIGAGQTGPILNNQLPALQETQQQQGAGQVAQSQPTQHLQQSEPGAQFEAATEHQTNQPLPGHLMSGGAGQPAVRGQSLFDMALRGFGGVASSNSTPLFALQNGPALGAVGLNEVLAQVSQTPEGEAMLLGLLDQVQGQTGVAIPQPMIDAVLADPSKLSNVLQLSPAELKRGVGALNARHANQAGQANPAASAPAFELPSRVDIAALADLDITVPEPELKQLGPGLWQGESKSDISEAQAKTNIAMAGVFDQLAAGEGFSVDYQGQTYDRLDSFLEALQEDGHTIEVGVKQRVANFSALKTQGPGGEMLDVPAPLFVRTGVTDADGNEATIPAVHSELTITIRKGEDTEGPGFDADLKWYQGISGTGFFPDKLTESPPWAGNQTRDIGDGEAAIDAIKLAGMFSDSVKEAASEQGLWLGGYGTTGVCNDSVAVIEHAMTGRNLTYPLLMTDESILPELMERMADNPQDSAAYERLMESVKALPSDATPNETSQLRAANTIPWEVGSEPFASTADARRILTQQ